MFIDYLTLLLINMSAGITILALFLGRWLEQDPKKAAAGFLITGAVALVAGFGIAITWPLPGIANIVFGEPSVLLGAVFFITGLALVFGWSLGSIGVYAAFAGVAAVVLAVRILVSGYTSEPIPAALGFAGAGVTAILMWPVLTLPKLKWLRMIAVVIAVLTALCWLIVALPAYFAHSDPAGAFSKWPGAIKALTLPAAPAQ